MASILETFEKQVAQSPDRLLYAFLDMDGKVTEQYTYTEFYKRTNQIASHIHHTYKVNVGDRVLLAYPPGLEMISAFFACVSLGLIPVPVYPPSLQGFQAAYLKMIFIAKDCDARILLTNRALYWSMKLNLKRDQLINFRFKRDHVSSLQWIVTDNLNGSSTRFPTAHSEILFLQYTSGSTSNPKGVMVTHENIISNCNAVVDHLPIGVSWLPQYHDMGLIGYYLFFALKGGTTYGFSPVDFIQRPALWLESITQFKGTASSAPNFAFDYCLRDDKISSETFEQLDLSSLQFLMTAAEPVRPKAYRDFLKKFEPKGLSPKSFFSAYGLAEFTLAVTNYGRAIKSFNADALKNNEAIPAITNGSVTRSVEYVSCGRPLGDTEIKIVDIDGQFTEVAPGKIGEVWISGNSKCLGYWNKPDLTNEIFHARGLGYLQSKPWLRSGDLGFLLEGELFICGRIKDLIIIRGQNYYPHDIEFVVEEDPMIRKGCAAAFVMDDDGADKLIVIAELRNSKKIPDAGKISRRVLQSVGIIVNEIHFIKARTIAKTSSGKIARHQVKKLFQSNDLIVLKSFSDHHGQNHLLNESFDGHQSDLHVLFFKYALNGNECATLSELGFDSLKLAEFTQDIKNYLQTRGFSELINWVDIRFIQKISSSDLFEILQDLGSTPLASKLRFREVFSSLMNERRNMDMHTMKVDATTARREGIDRKRSVDNTGSILLTGGTGFLGPFLIKSLLEQNTEDIYVLVRAHDSNSGMNRLLKAFQSINPVNQLIESFEKRVIPVCGDLSRRHFGLDDQQWNFLAKTSRTIYHNGAYVNYLFDYESMRDVNVGGTREVVDLAWSGRPKTVNHISTTFIFGWSVKEILLETDCNLDMEHLDFGYSQSKWVAEQIVKAAIDHGLPGRIFRPALISPAVDGSGVNLDISIRLLAFMLNHGIGTTAGNQVSFTPADIAANNTVAISNLGESIGKTFHVTRREYSNMLDITSILSELTGTKFANYSLNAFVPEVVRRCKKVDPLFPLLDFLVRSEENISAMEFKRYDNSNYQKYCDLSPWSKKDPSLKLVVSGILRFMENHSLCQKNLVTISND